MANVGGNFTNYGGSYVQGLQNNLQNLNSQVSQLAPYYELYSMIGANNPNLQLPDSFKQNSDFLKKQALQYQKLLAQRDKEASLFKDVNSKYNQYNGKDTLKTQVGKASQDFSTAHKDVLSKIEGLGNIFGNEKNELVDRINKATDIAKQSIAGQAQEKMAKAEGLTTRRGQGTKGMENISKAGISNEETQGISAAEQAGVNQIQQAVYLYNQLLNNLLQEYKATKDTYVLGNIQNALNVLNLLEQYKTGTTTTS